MQKEQLIQCHQRIAPYIHNTPVLTYKQKMNIYIYINHALVRVKVKGKFKVKEHKRHQLLNVHLKLIECHLFIKSKRNCEMSTTC